jgi:hypothetical protein
LFGGSTATALFILLFLLDRFVGCWRLPISHLLNFPRRLFRQEMAIGFFDLGERSSCGFRYFVDVLIRFKSERDEHMATVVEVKLFQAMLF